MKKRVSLVFAIIASLCMLVFLTACGNSNSGDQNENKNQTTTLGGENYGIKVEGTFPSHEEIDENGNTVVVSDYELSKPGKYGKDDIAMANDKVEFGFKIISHSYNTYDSYKTKYGSIDASYDKYLEFLDDPDFDSLKGDQKNYEKTTVCGVEAIKYEFSNRMIYVLNLEGEKASKQRCTLTVYSLDQNTSVTDLLEDDEVKTIMNSFVVSGK